MSYVAAGWSLASWRLLPSADAGPLTQLGDNSREQLPHLVGGHGCSSPCSLTSKSSTRDLITFDLHAEKPDVKIAPRVGPTFVMTRRAPPAGMITTQVGPKFVETTAKPGPTYVITPREAATSYTASVRTAIWRARALKFKPPAAFADDY